MKKVLVRLAEGFVRISTDVPGDIEVLRGGDKCNVLHYVIGHTAAADHKRCEARNRTKSHQ